jgi:hypothetical protein
MTKQGLEISTRVETEARYRPVSWGTARKLGVTQARVALAQKLMTIAQDEADMDALDDAISLFERHMAEMGRLIAQHIIELPREWLVDGAPEAMDYSDPDALDWVKSDHMQDIIAYMAGIPQTEAAKN